MLRESKSFRRRVELSLTNLSLYVTVDAAQPIIGQNYDNKGFVGGLIAKKNQTWGKKNLTRLS